MALNPAKQEEALNSPVERASNLNDPQFENQQGYFPYDLTHQELVTPLFGLVTPTMHLDTVPGDRTVVKDNTKLILNQINGNFLSTLNQYVDSFYVPLRSVFPSNYEKLIPNPVKGEDLPNSALPQVPINMYFNELYHSDLDFDFEGEVLNLATISDAVMNGAPLSDNGPVANQYLLGRLILLCTILSRGQLLDYLGIQFDTLELNKLYNSDFQYKIDAFFNAVYSFYEYVNTLSRDDWDESELYLSSRALSLTDDKFEGTPRIHDVNDKSQFRSAISDILESGRFPIIPYVETEDIADQTEDLTLAVRNLIISLDELFGADTVPTRNVAWLEDVNEDPDVFTYGQTLNIGKILAYQQIIAHYYSNDHVDNVYSSELFMQNLRSVMFPSVGGFTNEPTFDMNGVSYEYDYISYGSFFTALMRTDTVAGVLNRQFVYGTLMFLLRRSLRFGDYFATSRPNMLAVSDQLGINVTGGQVSPIDVTKNLLMQRYLNAANYIGQGFLQYMSSIYGIKPSDTGCIPRFISHRHIPIQNQITNNTSDNQGAQTTNLVGYSDNGAFDVFIDDFGYLISLTSFDVLPIYNSGIENTYHLADRYDYFNPMLQGIGDQPIRSSELLGAPSLYSDVFGYTMRNGEYKYKLSKSHGAFVNSLPGYALTYPLYSYNKAFRDFDLNIDPDFIRDKPVYLDRSIPKITGVSPAEYFHFILSCTNQVQCARKIQATPGVLF